MKLPMLGGLSVMSSLYTHQNGDDVAVNGDNRNKMGVSFLGYPFSGWNESKPCWPIIAKRERRGCLFLGYPFLYDFERRPTENHNFGSSAKDTPAFLSEPMMLRIGLCMGLSVSFEVKMPRLSVPFGRAIA